MSRRSARIRGRKEKIDDIPERVAKISIRGQKRKFEDNTEQEIANNLNKKQKKNETCCKIDMEVEKRRHQFVIQNQWQPLTRGSVVVPSGVLQQHNSQTSTCSTYLPPKPHAPFTASYSGTTYTSRDNGHTSELQTVMRTTSQQRACVAMDTNLQNSSCLISPHKNTESSSPEICVPPSSKTLSSFRLAMRHALPMRDSPLPSLNWADSREVWQLMIRKEELYVRSADMLSRHPALQPRMRAILLDWLIEVCEVYRLHRETYHLAVDFVDRYLCSVTDIHKSQLQLLGITALFVAAKIEEIYPPKLTEFSYVTDGACTDKEILDQELVMLKALKWDLYPFTVNSWLNVFLQLVNNHWPNNVGDQAFVMPRYSQHTFIQIARLLDMCSLDVGSVQFPYSILATASTLHVASESVALSVSGYTRREIDACVRWMEPYARVLAEYGPLDLRHFDAIPLDDAHNIQTHSIDLSLLEKAQALSQALQNQESRASPDVTRKHPGIITPPQTPANSAKQSSCTTAVPDSA